MNKEDDEQRFRSQSVGAPSNKTAAFVSSEEDSAESSSDSEESGDERYFMICLYTLLFRSRKLLLYNMLI